MISAIRPLVLLLLVTSFTSAAFAETIKWDLKSDSWTAVDALGRKLPGFDECGPVREGKFVGIFYFLWHGAHGTDGPYDITKILADNPEDPQWGPPGSFHHWGEPELGYYLSNDPYVMRKHCRMLADAGVDTLIFDVTNAFTYTNNYLLMCKVMRQLRQQGEKTPQICFIANSSSDKVVQKLYDEFYSKNLFPELWFRWHGKPLMLANPEKLPQEIKDFFTFRQSWAWHDPNSWFGDGRDKWPWLDRYPQAYGWHEPGKPEEMAVCVAEHPITNIGRSNYNNKQPDPENFRSDEGLHFSQQFEHALKVDPEFIFITGWNEWVAQRFLNKGKTHLAGKQLEVGDSYFVDAYSKEYSRDIEPMKGGYTDNYYYQMISYIRRFKGVEKPEAPSKPKTIKIDGSFADWNSVRPEYRDHIGDTEHRLSKGWGNAGSYVNRTGRNDFVRSKVTYDRNYVYFYVETKEPMTSWKDTNWMMLFIDSDCDHRTGWEGYDYLINYSPVNSQATTLKKCTGGWNWKTVSTIQYRVNGNKMEIAVPRKDIGKDGSNGLSLDFHWADNIQKAGDIIEFSINGDSAPDRRFNYRFNAQP